MPFDRRIFKHPAVEYIPLYPLTLALETAWNSASDRSLLYVFCDEHALQLEQARLDIVLPTTVDFEQKIVLMAVGHQIKYAYYRGYTTIVLGEDLPTGYHIVAIPRNYFYKNRIHFALYDNKANKAAWANIVLK